VGLIVLDASVVIAARDRDDAHHDNVTAALRARDRSADLAVPASAYAEAMVGPTQRGAAAVRRADALFDELARIEPVTRPVAKMAAALRLRGLRLPDALVVAAGIELDADAVWTTDARWRRFDKRVRVIA